MQFIGREEMKLVQSKKTVYYEINGKRYDNIDDIPPEFRDMVRAINDHPEASKKTSVTKVTSVSTGELPAGFAEIQGGGHREKFLRETVLPNLHLMDAKTQAEVLREISGQTEKRRSPRRTLFWLILYAALGLLSWLGYSAIKNMLSAP